MFDKFLSCKRLGLLRAEMAPCLEPKLRVQTRSLLFNVSGLTPDYKVESCGSGAYTFMG